MGFQAQVRERYNVMAERKDFSNETYWTCFAFDGIHPDDLHCTHKFFGEQTDEAAQRIKTTLDNWFAEHPYEPFKLPFTEEDWFGADKNVRVLKPVAKPRSFGTVFLMDLRKALDAYAKDNYPSYQPHVSTPDREEVSMPFTRYCFCQGDNIIAEWT